MNTPFYNEIETDLNNHPRVSSVETVGVKEINKKLAPFDVGGCFRKRFKIQPVNDEIIDDFALDIRGILKKNNSALMKNDDSLRLISSDTEGYLDEKEAFIDAYYVPNPE